MAYAHDREIFEIHPKWERELEEFTEYDDRYYELNSEFQDEVGAIDQELESFFGSIFDKLQGAFNRGKELLVVRQAILAGNRDENQLTNVIFFARHPERQGRRIEKTEPNYQQLRQEWLDIRDRLIRPALRSLSPSVPLTSGRGDKLTPFKQRIQKIAKQEWEFFERGSRKEHEHGFWQRIVRYWAEGLKNSWIDTKEEVKTIAWSAAFISWVMRKAGAGNQFKYSARHSVYIRDAIRNRKSNSSGAAFKGYKLHEVAPNVGDLVCTSRGKDAGKVGYDTTRDYESHCDVVVATRPGKIDVIGGNVGNSVSRKTLKTDSQGRLIDTSAHWFVVIKNLL